jgi:hypothetical protein
MLASLEAYRHRMVAVNLAAVPDGSSIAPAISSADTAQSGGWRGDDNKLRSEAAALSASLPVALRLGALAQVFLIAGFAPFSPSIE